MNHLKYCTITPAPGPYAGLLPSATIAYETYGKLNPERSNAILLIHSFSLHSHPAAHFPGDKPGWWEWAVGPGKIFDTTRYYIVCSNNLGSCFGSTGPTSSDAAAKLYQANAFPFPTIPDIVFCQQQLQHYLGIPRWHGVVGASLGGMAALEWAAAFPEQTASVFCLNTGARISCIGQQLADLQEDWIRLAPETGLVFSERLAATLFSGEEFFRQNLAPLPDEVPTAPPLHPGSYRCFLHALRQFDLRPEAKPIAAASHPPAISLVGCAEDFLFPPWIMDETLQRFLPHTSINSQLVHSPFGHDAFLSDIPLYSRLLQDIVGQW